MRQSTQTLSHVAKFHSLVERRTPHGGKILAQDVGAGQVAVDVALGLARNRGGVGYKLFIAASSNG